MNTESGFDSHQEQRSSSCPQCPHQAWGEGAGIWCVNQQTTQTTYMWGGGTSLHQVQNVSFIVARSTSEMTYAGCPTIQIILSHNQQWGTQWHSWLGYCTTSCKVTVSIPEGALEFFIDIILPAAL